MSLIPVEGYSGLYRDSTTNAIINKNSKEYNSYISKKNAKENEKKKMESIEDELHSLKNELDDIKNLLKVIVKNVGS
jgi:seryl-tRNA synthetase